MALESDDPEITYKLKKGQSLVGLSDGKAARTWTRNGVARITASGVWAPPPVEPPPVEPPPVEPPPVVTPPPATGTPVGTNVQAAIDAAQPGASLYLTQSVTLSSRLSFNRKSGLTLDLAGKTLQFSGTSTIGLHLQGCRDVTVKNGIVIGGAAYPVAYIYGNQDAHAVHLAGGNGLHFADLDLRNFQGDGFYLAQDGTTPGSNATIDRCKVSDVGRMGIAPVAWRGLVAKDMTYHNMGWRPIDVEPDWNSSYQQVTADLQFIGGVSTGWNGRWADNSAPDCTFGYIGTPYGSGDSQAAGKIAPLIENVTIEGHVVVDGITGMRTHIDCGRGYRAKNVVIRGNEGKHQAIVYGVVHGNGVDGLQVINNKQPVNQGAYAVAVSSATGVVATGNTGTGMAGQVKP